MNNNVTQFPKRQIRGLATADLAQAAELLNRCWHDAYRRQLPPRLLSERTLDFWTDYLEKRQGRCWVSWVGPRPAGLVTVSANCVDDLWVLRRFGRRGHGRALLDRALRYIGERGFAYAQAGCEDFNQDAVAFFAHMGWQEIGREPLLGLVPGRQLEALVFSRPVPGNLAETNGSGH